MRIEPADDAMFQEHDAWCYDPPYDFYDSDGLPVKNPERFFAARDDDGTLVGFYFFELHDDALFYGFGLRPDLTGRGLGERFVLAGLEFARPIYGRRRVTLHVAAFNERAIRLYQRLGFTETGRHTETFDGYGAVEFIDMEKPAEHRRRPAGQRSVTVTWRRLDEPDFALLRGWLEQPHVARWWNHETTSEAVHRDFGPAARGEEPSEDFLALLDDRPVGLVQRCRLADYPEYRDDLAPIVDVPAGAMSIDYLIGEPAQTGHGLGTRMIASMVARTWSDHPEATCVVVPVVAANRVSWRALEKAGLRRVGQGPITPDNPADDPLHYVYRVDRPSTS
nr:GNAT family N-acetyltransferase [Protofrankia symbiont of Coriaria myrtifolia]